MTIARTAACLVASAFVLAACAKSPTAGSAQAQALASQGGATQAATPPATASASAGSDTTPPAPKPGLWEIKMSHVGGDGQTHAGVTQQCMDAAAMASGKQTAADYVKANCSKNETRRAGDIWTTDMVCKAAGSVMTTHSVTNMAGDDSAYHTDMTTAFDPPSAGGGASSSTTMDGKWIGACKPT